jgi:uncharacterized protein with HEPN domain
MRIESKKLLRDVLDASDLLAAFVEGKSFADYEGDPMLRSAVERQFEIIGEALRQLGSKDPAVVEAIPDHRRIVSFRNVLIHGYAQVENKLVWEALSTRLGPLRASIRRLLEPTRP